MDKPRKESQLVDKPRKESQLVDKPQKKVIFLDRDGTIIENVLYLNDPLKVKFLPHTFEGMRQLAEAGFEFAIVTNQSGIVRGLVTDENLTAIHKKIENELVEQGLKILKFYHAPFKGEHPMRKPNPGMIFQAAKDFPIDLKESWIFGDRRVDTEAGRKAGLKGSIQFTTTEYLEMDAHLPESEVTAADMLEAANFVLSF